MATSENTLHIPLVNIFSYNNGVLTINKNETTTKTYKNCRSFSIIKRKNTYTLNIRQYVYNKYCEDDGILPFYDIKTTKIKISESFAKMYISAIRLLAHTLKKNCYQLKQYQYNEIILYLQEVPEIESENEFNDQEYSEYDYNYHTEKMIVVMSELQDYFMDRMFN